LLCCVHYCVRRMSGTSTPQGSRSPPPEAGGGGGPQQQPGFNAATLARRFVRQYYQNLMTTPDQVHKFYQPTSLLTDGFGNVDTQPLAFDSVYQGDSDNLKTRFYQNDFSITVELEEGAIDAQLSVNGGVLIVVTGHVFYTPNTSEDEDAAVDDPYRKRFVHTIFLNLHTVGSKKLFYIHNDILRFFKDIRDPSEQPPVVQDDSLVVAETTDADAVSPEHAAAAPSPSPIATIDPIIAVLETTTTTTVDPIAAVKEPKTTEEPQAEKEEEPQVVLTASAPVEDEAPGGGVEESKEEMPPSVHVIKPSKADKPNKKDASNKGGPKKEEADKDGTVAKSSSTPTKKGPVKELVEIAAVAADTGRKSPVPPPSPAPKPTPNTWASLVAAGAGDCSVASSAVPVKNAAPLAAAKSPPRKPSVPSMTEKPSAPSSSVNEKREAGGASTNPGGGSGGNPNNTANNNSGSSISNNNTNNTSNNHNKMGTTNNNVRPPKRDPDCTLVIKNLPDNTKEADVLGVFETFATQTKSKVVGITVAAHRGIAFIDFDSINPVTKAVNRHKEEPIRLQGRILEVDQKTAEQRARRAAQGGGGRGNNFRSGSPSRNNGAANRFGGGGGAGSGRGGQRRRDGGRGDRGGGMGGGRGRGDRDGGMSGGRGGRGGR
jgi:Nuclear transport factor 2 (NTF2) domain/RNA recognition motif. (a.k.a. RRM, RBD, or RNP domain)